jgi:DNA-binding transcriptional LysR family regulator
MKLLEEELGVSLFAPQGRRLILTSAGRAFLPAARRVLKAWEQASFDAHRAGRQGYSHLRLGAVESAATYLLPNALATLTGMFPELKLTLQTGRSAGLLRLIEAEEIDLALVAHSRPPPGVASKKVAPYHLQFYGRRDSFAPLARCRTMQELSRFPLIEIRPPPGADTVIPSDAVTFARAETAETVKALVLAGFGVGDLLRFMLTPSERKQLVTAKVPHDPDCGLFLVRSRALQDAGWQPIVDALLTQRGREEKGTGQRRRS